jgi:C-terminal duplication domain of Friend of PRMT1
LNEKNVAPTVVVFGTSCLIVKSGSCYSDKTANRYINRFCAESLPFCHKKMARSRNAKSNSNTAAAAGAVTQKETPKRKGRNSKVKSQKQPQTTNISRGKGKQVGTASNAKGKSTKRSKPLPEKKLTAEELDKQMDDYMMRNEKTAEKILEDQMDDYWAKKGKAKEDEEKEVSGTAEDE